mgnify:CR=1 FL=1
MPDGRPMVKVSRQRSAELRIELLDGAAAELRRVGFDAMALTAIATRCGMATSAIYNRFPTKAALVAALIAERIEPCLGNQVDRAASDFWSGTSDPSPIDLDQLGVIAELLLAARHDATIREPVHGFIRRHCEIALDARAQGESRGLVRSGQDPRVQVLFRAARWIGNYVCGLASAPPERGSMAIDELMRRTLLDLPTDTPLPIEEPSSRRVAPPMPTRDDHTHDAICAALVDAAADVFADKGYEAATVSDIARRAGLTTGAIYNRFDGKADLMTEVIINEIGPNAQHRGFDLIGTLAASSQLSNAALDVILEHFDDDTNVRDRGLRLASRDAARREPQVAAVIGPIQDNVMVSMADFVRTAQGEGLIRHDVDPEAVVWWVVANPLGISLLRGVFPELRIDDWAPTYATALEILRTPPR